jgi:tetratricopeptide (TPR) repeat protein
MSLFGSSRYAAIGSNSRVRWVVLLLVLVCAVGVLGWLYWTTRRSQVNFLPRRSPAEWIVYPSAADANSRPCVDLGTSFRRSFNVEAVPPQMALRVAAFGHYSVSINETLLGAAAQRGANWKQPDRFDVSRQLRAGSNAIEVTVLNSNGPPALWLALDGTGASLISNETWESSYAGATWRRARLAGKPNVALAGSLVHSEEEPWGCLRARWQTLLVFAALAAVVWWLASLWGSRGRSALLDCRVSAPHGSLSNLRAAVASLARRDLLLVCGLGVLWVALFANNLSVLPVLVGFDAQSHLKYIWHLQVHHRLPLPSDGYEMHHPPLYYVLSAMLLGLLRLPVLHHGATLAVRLMGLGIGVAHLTVVWAALRLLFPEERSKHVWGALLAAFLPAQLYLSQYVTNELLAAALVSASVYLALRILKRGCGSWKAYAGLGLCLGAALLTKSSALLAVPVIVGVLLCLPATNHQPCPIRGLGLALGLCLLVCGWHYGRLWLLYGNPLIGVWDPKTGFAWWQQDGYRTSTYYLKFGESLRHPWFGALQSFADGIYSTLWGDGLFGGMPSRISRPPWNYDLMAIGYWLALPLTAAVLLGAVLALVRFVRRPQAVWLMVLGLSSVVVFALIQFSLAVPYYCSVKAFYAMSALIPLCAYAALGFDALTRRSTKLRLAFGIMFGIWAINSYASFWILGWSPRTNLARACSLDSEGRQAEAVQILEMLLQENSQDLDARAMLVSLSMAAGDNEAAAKQAEPILRGNPAHAEAQAVLGELLARQGRTAEASEHARRAMQLAPGNAVPYEQLAMLLVQLERYDEAATVVRQGLSIAPLSLQLRLIESRIRPQPSANNSSQGQLFPVPIR